MFKYVILTLFLHLTFLHNWGFCIPPPNRGFGGGSRTLNVPYRATTHLFKDYKKTTIIVCLKFIYDSPIQNGDLTSICAKVNYHRHLGMQIVKRCYLYTSMFFFYPNPLLGWVWDLKHILFNCLRWKRRVAVKIISSLICMIAVHCSRVKNR